MRYFTMVTILMLLMTAFSFAQPSKDGTGMNIPKIGVVTGKIIDGSDNKPLGYTNVIIKKSIDSSIATGAISKADGSFKVDEIPVGNYYAEIKYIGYEKKIIQNIKIGREKHNYGLGDIILQIAASTTEEVVVKTDRLAVEYKIDKKIVNVSQNMTAIGGTAIEALENVPSVTVNVDGDLALRGSSNYTVFVNGKPSILQGSDGLRQIPSETIDKIELITNPSVKYDPQGMGGIINVILKDEIKQGFNGMFNAGIGLNNKYNTDFTVNFFNDKWTFFVGGNYRTNLNAGSMKSTVTEFFFDPFINSYYDSSQKIVNGAHDKTHYSYTGKAGVGYNFTKMTNISVEGTFGLNGRKRETDAENYYRSFDGDSVSNILSESGSTSESDFFGTNVNFQHKFDNDGHQLDALFHYNIKNSSSHDKQTEFNSNTLWEKGEKVYALETEGNSEDENDVNLKIDYVYPINSLFKLESGYGYRSEFENEVYIFYDIVDNVKIKNNIYSKNMEFSEDVHSIYSTFSGGYKKFLFMGGLRAETTNRLIVHDTLQSSIDDFDWFPSLHTSFQINEDNQLSINYGKRISRPSGWNLDPFITYVNSYTRRQGNPDLKPEYSDSYELNYQWSFAKGSYVALETYHRHGKNLINRISKRQEDNTYLITFANLDDDYSTGLELSLNWRPLEFINFSASGSMYHYKVVRGPENQIDFDTETQVFTGNMGLMLAFSKSTRFMLNGFYSGESLTAQGKSDAFGGLSASIRQDFFDSKLNLTLSMRDILNSMKHGGTTYGSGYTSQIQFTGEYPVINLNISYRINDYKKRKTDNGGKEMEGGKDDIF